MASDKSYVDFIMDQLSAVSGVSSRKMFGEYAIFVGAKVVALICDNSLYVKPTKAGRKFIGEPVEASPYAGAKPSFLIRDGIEDRGWLHELITLTHDELPEPKPKTKRRSASK
jgi:TfoX/Sxy family transcriptional regulator of competence genes